VVVRRLAEVVAATLPLLAILAIPVLVGAPALYGWARPHQALGGAGVEGAAAGLAHRRLWLNTPFFVARVILYLAFWSWFARVLWRRSVAQDETRDPAVTVGLSRLSAWGLVALALTLTFGAFDLLMSIDPTWSSTIFGVYVFAGCAVGAYALLTLLSLGLQRSGRLERVISMEHYHDLGKLMFTFAFFWGYIAFSQYLLVWYGNLPEESGWYLRRQTGSWAGLGIALLLGQLLLPMAGLISRWAKRSRAALAFWAVWILVMHWIDLYWVVMPELSPAGVAPHALDLLCTVGVGAIWLAGAVRTAGGRALVPRGDPLLAESLRFENA